MFWILVGLAAATAIYYYLIKPHKYWTERGVKQTAPVLIAGDSWGTLTRTQSIADMVYQVYNACPNTRYSGMYQFLFPTLVVKDPALIKQITVKDFDHFLDHRTFLPTETDPFWSSNLFALTGSRWKDMRSTVSPAIVNTKMKYMYTLISESAEHFVRYFLNKTENMIAIELKDTFTKYTNDIIATTAFGFKCDSLEQPENEFYMMTKKITNFGGFRKSFVFFVFLFIPKIFTFLRLRFFTKSEENFFTNLVKKTVEFREKQQIIRPDLIHMLMEARKTGLTCEENNEANIDAGFTVSEESEMQTIQERIRNREITDLDIAGQALSFIVTGFDAVASIMSFSFYELAIHPDIQKRLQEEINQTLQSCNRKLTYEHLLKMKYLDMVICECLRKWPSILAVDRVCTKPYTIQPTSLDEKSVHLKKGDVLWLPVFGLHRDPQYFPDPEKFDPERFSDENKDKIIPYTYIPFGCGPRNCIGSRFAILEIKALMFHLLSKFDIVPTEKTQIPIKLSKKEFSLTAESGFWFGLQRRHFE